MRIFKRRKEKALSAGQEKFARRIAGGILKAQRKVADELNDLTAGITPQNWIVLLISLCLAFGSYCLSLLLQIL